MRPGALEGKRAIVTGASSGIGAGVAGAFVHEGANVLAVGRDSARLERVVASASGPGQAMACAEDITSDGSAQRIVAEACAVFGGVDVLVHVAGVMEGGPFAEFDADSLDRQWAVNVRAPLVLTHAALGELRGGGAVIFVSSVCGRIGFPAAAAYCATKGAIEMAVRSLAVELGREQVRVNAVAPGWVETPMSAGPLSDPAYADDQLAATPIGRFGTPADAAAVVVFLASDAARYVHGAVYAVDGGFPALTGGGHDTVRGALASVG